MLVTMTKTVRGSQDGFKVELFEAGQTYEIAGNLAADFVRKGHAEKTQLIDGCTNPAWYNIFAEMHHAAKSEINSEYDLALLNAKTAIQGGL